MNQTIIPLLTPARAAGMTAKELAHACAVQVERQYPDLSPDDLRDRGVALFVELAAQVHDNELAAAQLRRELREAEAYLLDSTAATLRAPELGDDGHLYGAIAYRDAAGHPMIITLRFATVEHLDRPFHLHHREAYAETARVMRRHGIDTYVAACEAGIFTEGKSA